MYIVHRPSAGRGASRKEQIEQRTDAPARLARFRRRADGDLVDHGEYAVGLEPGVEIEDPPSLMPEFAAPRSQFAFIGIGITPPVILRRSPNGA
jgi:hypothetical protein